MTDTCVVWWSYLGEEAGSTGSTSMKASRCEGARHASGVSFRTQLWGGL